jgi:hypothetical protein
MTNIDGFTAFVFPFLMFMVISDQEKKEKKKKKKMSGFMEEGPVEKKLRETGEWVTTKTEGGFRSNGTSFLVTFDFLSNILWSKK